LTPLGELTALLQTSWLERGSEGGKGKGGKGKGEGERKEKQVKGKRRGGKKKGTKGREGGERKRERKERNFCAVVIFT